MSAQVLTVSTKGQVSIPADIRRQFDIDAGDKLVAYTFEDAIVLKLLKLPEIDEFAAALQEAENWAKENAITEQAIQKAIDQIRDEYDR